VYAIVRAGGHQYRVGVGDELVIDRVMTSVGDSLQIEPILVVKDGVITHDEKSL